MFSDLILSFPSGCLVGVFGILIHGYSAGGCLMAYVLEQALLSIARVGWWVVVTPPLWYGSRRFTFFSVPIPPPYFTVFSAAAGTVAGVAESSHFSGGVCC